MSSFPAFEARGLGVRYGALTALDNVGFSVDLGEILGLIGPNGAGKSSCFDAISNMAPRSGSVFLGGQCIDGVPPHRLTDFGLRRTFQQNAFFDDLSVIENAVAVLQPDLGVELSMSIVRPLQARRLRRSVRLAAAELLKRFAVDASCHEQRPANLPYGTQRMLSIALAYGNGAKVLLLDEPAAGLGGIDMKRLLEIVNQLRCEGLALVLIEHHMDLIMSVADRIAVLDQGRLIAFDSPTAVRNNPAVIEAYLGRSA